ncbi:MAG: YchJ family protein [Reichenbachiella sp.]|uniref:YchJ family protein n=1 Tax=Reichenbachiella sp. TaxID=2184521 RepID=UPI003263FBF1
MNEIDCPCGSGKKYSTCCNPTIKGQTATTALALMRSRYTAYQSGQADYLYETTHARHRAEYKIDEIRKWSDENTWTKLEVVSVEHGGASDERGVVEFKAYFRDSKEKIQVHHERSTFLKEDGMWYYLEGDINPQEVDLMKKITRNDPCPCGSGKKYKKCCG